MIDVKDLTKTYGDHQVLKGINEHIHKGEKVAIIGPSGSGKSTFLRCLNLLETPTKGSITFDGTEITDPKVWCRDNCEKSWEKVLSPGHLPTQYESPALAKDLAGLPPLFSYIGQLDPGRDENIAYWTRMMEAGVPVEYHVFPGCYHCFELSVPEADYSKAAYALSYAALRRAFYGEA